MRSRRGSTSSVASTGRARHARSAIGDRHIAEHRSSSTLPIGALSKGDAARLHSTDPILHLGVGNTVIGTSAEGPVFGPDARLHQAVSEFLVVQRQDVSALLVRWWCRRGGGCGGRHLQDRALRRWRPSERYRRDDGRYRGARARPARVPSSPPRAPRGALLRRIRAASPAGQAQGTAEREGDERDRAIRAPRPPGLRIARAHRNLPLRRLDHPSAVAGPRLSHAHAAVLAVDRVRIRRPRAAATGPTASILSLHAVRRRHADIAAVSLRGAGRIRTRDTRVKSPLL